MTQQKKSQEIEFLRVRVDGFEEVPRRPPFSAGRKAQEAWQAEKEEHAAKWREQQKERRRG